jgi:hypothetical protein
VKAGAPSTTTIMAVQHFNDALAHRGQKAGEQPVLLGKPQRAIGAV